MNKKFKITPRQKQIIIGKILGDACLETANGKTYRLKIEQGEKQKDYVFWLYQELKNIASSEPKLKLQKRKSKTNRKYWFNSSYSPSLRFYGQQFYQDGKKVVPKLINRWLTPLAFAIWFMDDGSIKSKECKGRIINTQAFDDVSLKRLQLVIKSNFGIETKLRKQKEGKQIYIPAGEYEKFRRTVGKYVLSSFKYKLG